jgi:hypothetical protein
MERLKAHVALVAGILAVACASGRVPTPADTGPTAPVDTGRAEDSESDLDSSPPDSEPEESDSDGTLRTDLWPPLTDACGPYFPFGLVGTKWTYESDVFLMEYEVISSAPTQYGQRVEMRRQLVDRYTPGSSGWTEVWSFDCTPDEIYIVHADNGIEYWRPMFYSDMRLESLSYVRGPDWCPSWVDASTRAESCFEPELDPWSVWITVPDPVSDYLYAGSEGDLPRLTALGTIVTQIRYRNVFQHDYPWGAREPYTAEYAFAPGIGIVEWKHDGTYASPPTHQVLTSFCRPDIGCIP